MNYDFNLTIQEPSINRALHFRRMLIDHRDESLDKSKTVRRRR
jgi:hypothetical protein